MFPSRGVTVSAIEILFAAAALSGLAWILLAACNADGETARVQATPMSEVVEQAGWRRVARDVPAVLSVKIWVERSVELDLGPSVEIDWEREDRGDVGLVSARAERENNRRLQRFAGFRKSGRVTLLDADAAAAYRFGLLVIHPDPPIRAVAWDRLLETGKGGDAVYTWDGCFIHSGLEAIGDIELRATLLVELPDGLRMGLPGEPRHHTSRSGIPKSLKPGDFFCTVLKSRRLPRHLAEKAIRETFGVLEAHWKEADGNRRFAAISAARLDRDAHAGSDVEGLAVVRGGVLRDGTSDEPVTTLIDPSLVNVERREGGRFFVLTHGKHRGWLDAGRVVAVYPNRQADLDPKLRAMLETMVKKGLSGDAASACGLFRKGPGLVQGHRLIEDIKRRFPVEEPLDLARLTIHILQSETVDGKLMIQYFVWAQTRSGRLWQTYDTVMADRTMSGWRLAVPDLR